MNDIEIVKTFNNRLAMLRYLGANSFTEFSYVLKQCDVFLLLILGTNE